MTKAICFKCGEEKFGALTACKSCGAIPKGDQELALSLVLCEHLSTYSGPHFQDNSLSCALLHGDIRNERSKEAEGPHPRVQGQGGS